MIDAKVSPQGMFALAMHEGIVPGPYKDSVGVWTYGVGHTAAAGAPDPVKMKRGMPLNLDAELIRVVDLYARDIERYADDVRKVLRRPVEQHHFDALLSFHYNTGAIARATVTKLINTGNVEAAADAFMNWQKPAEVRDRRRAEQRLFRDGIYPSGDIPVWGVTVTGRVIWRRAGQLSRSQFLAMVEKKTEAPA